MDHIKTITVYSTRGGNGKTITSVMLAIAAANKGLKTVIIDADVEAPSLMHLIQSAKEGPNWVDYLDEKVEGIDQMIQNTKVPNLDVIYSPAPKIGKAFLGWRSKNFWQIALRRSMTAVEELRDLGYQIIVVDNQSGTSLNSVNNMVLADATVMVIRPATYGVGAAEKFLPEMYRLLQGLKKRKDFYIWNQVPHLVTDEEKVILERFLTKWDENMKEHGLHYGGLIPYNSKLNLGLLGDTPSLLDHFDDVSDPITKLLSLLLE